MKGLALRIEVRLRKLLHLRPRIRKLRTTDGGTVYQPTHYDWM